MNKALDFLRGKYGADIRGECRAVGGEERGRLRAGMKIEGEGGEAAVVQNVGFHGDVAVWLQYSSMSFHLDNFLVHVSSGICPGKAVCSAESPKDDLTLRDTHG